MVLAVGIHRLRSEQLGCSGQQRAVLYGQRYVRVFMPDPPNWG